MQRTPACLSVLESKFLARSARTEQSLHFFRVPKARFSSTSNERDTVTRSRFLKPNNKNRLCGRHGKNCRKQRLECASQCNSSAVSDLVAAEMHLCNRHICLVVVASQRRVPNTQSGSFKKNNKYMRTLTERGSSESLPWSQAHLIQNL